MTRARCATAAAVQGWLKLSRARSLLAGLACLELAGESVDFVQLLLLLFPLTRSFSLLFAVLSQVRCSPNPKSVDLTQVEFCVAFGDQRLVFLLAFDEEILTRNRPSSNCSKMSIVTK